MTWIFPLAAMAVIGIAVCVFVVRSTYLKFYNRWYADGYGNGWKIGYHDCYLAIRQEQKLKAEAAAEQSEDVPCYTL